MNGVKIVRKYYVTIPRLNLVFNWDFFVYNDDILWIKINFH